MTNRKGFYFLFFLFLLGSFFFQLDHLVVASQEISEREKKIKEISRKNENLETARVQTYHLKEIEAVAKDSNFERLGRVYFIEAAPAMAAR